MHNNNKSLSDKMSMSSGYVNELYSLDNQMDHRSSIINNIPKCQKFEKLRIIKPFDEKQLLEFYNNDLFNKIGTLIQHFREHFYVNVPKNNNYYDLIMRLDKSIERFKDTKTDVSDFIQIIRKEEDEKCWAKSEHHIHHSGRCFDGNFVETDHKYIQYKFNSNCIDKLNEYYYLLRERIVNEHVVHSYFYKYFQIRFEFIIFEALDIIKCLKEKPGNYQVYSSSITSDEMTILSTNYGLNDSFDNESTTQLSEFFEIQKLKKRLFELISALFNYYRRTVNYNEQLKHDSYQAIVYIWTDFYKIATFYDRLFFLYQILLCPTGSSRDFAPLIDPLNPLPLKTNQYELGREYIDFGVTCIFIILSPKILKETELDKQSNKNHLTNNNNDQWLFIDTNLEEELVQSSLSDLNEDDIITYLSRVPFSEMLQFMSLINSKMINEDDESDNNEIISSTETSMIRLFAFNTRLMLIFRNGLENFNCLHYKKLILYIASMIK